MAVSSVEDVEAAKETEEVEDISFGERKTAGFSDGDVRNAALAAPVERYRSRMPWQMSVGIRMRKGRLV